MSTSGMICTYYSFNASWEWKKLTIRSFKRILFFFFFCPFNSPDIYRCILTHRFFDLFKLVFHVSMNNRRSVDFYLRNTTITIVYF